MAHFIIWVSNKSSPLFFQAYVSPYRPDLKDGQCIICGKYCRAKDAGDDNPDNLCKCTSATRCDGCKVGVEKTADKLIGSEWAVKCHGSEIGYLGSNTAAGVVSI